MANWETGKYRTFSFYIRQVLLYLFFINLLLLFFFLLGNFQGFQDSTQSLILKVLEKSSLIYLFLAFLFFIQTIVEILMLGKSSPGFLIFLAVSCGLMLPVYLMPAVTGRLFF